MADTRADHQEGELTSSLGAAIGVVMIAAARFAWLYSHAEVDTPSPTLALLLFELPLIFCLLPLITGERPDRSIKSGGMVFGTALSFCLVASPLWFDAQFTAWGKRTGDPAAPAGWLPACLIFAVWILAFSRRYRNYDRREFTRRRKGEFSVPFLLHFLLLAYAFDGY